MKIKKLNLNKDKIIPPISDEEIEEMLEILTPVRDVGDNFLMINTEYIDKRNQSYIWDTLFKGSLVIGVPPPGLFSTTIISFHNWNYYGFFKPTLAETLAAIRDKVENWREAKYFTHLSPETVRIIGDYHACNLIVWGDEKKAFEGEEDGKD